MKLKSKVDSILKEVNQLKNTTFAVLSKQADHPNISRISSNPSIFTIRSSNIENTILDPTYYDLPYQYSVIQEKLSDAKIETIVPFLQTVIKERRIRTEEANWLKLHPTVIKKLSELL